MAWAFEDQNWIYCVLGGMLGFAFVYWLYYISVRKCLADGRKRDRLRELGVDPHQFEEHQYD